MQHCVWCYYVLEDFNDLIDDMMHWYGPEKVAILKVDGQLVREMSKRYQVKGYPSFIAIGPNTNGKLLNVFSYSPRNYDTLKKWMIETMGNTPLRT